MPTEIRHQGRFESLDEDHGIFAGAVLVHYLLSYDRITWLLAQRGKMDLPERSK